jgi:phosphoribosylformylglycinamidine synthase
MFRAEVRVELKHGVTDPEGENTEKALQLLGYDSVEDVHSSTIYRIDLDEDTREGARSRVEEMCERLLANPVIHDYSIDVAEA